MQTYDTTPDKFAANADLPSPAPQSCPTVTQTPLTGPDSDLVELIEDFVGSLRKINAKALGCRIEIGARLHGWRDDLGKPDWLALLRSGRLPFSARTAQSLARIGGHSVLANPRYVEMLPASLTVLNEVAALPPSFVEESLVGGLIQPETTLAEAKRMVAEHRARKQAMLDEQATPNVP